VACEEDGERFFRRAIPRPIGGTQGAAHDLAHLTGLPTEVCVEGIREFCWEPPKPRPMIRRDVLPLLFACINGSRGAIPSMPRWKLPWKIAICPFRARPWCPAPTGEDSFPARILPGVRPRVLHRVEGHGVRRPSFPAACPA
jgi:hypothetical protein